MTISEICNAIGDLNNINPETNHAIGNDLLQLYYAGKEKEAIAYIREYFQCDNDFAEKSFKVFKDKMGAPPSPQQIARANAEAREALNKPKCPTCQSTNLRKISTTAKVTNTVVFGIFGTKRHKTFHCNNCGYEW